MCENIVHKITVSEWSAVGFEIHLTLTASTESAGESQRDSDSKPKVARHELPWEIAGNSVNPNGVATRRWAHLDTAPINLV